MMRSVRLSITSLFLLFIGKALSQDDPTVTPAPIVDFICNTCKVVINFDPQTWDEFTQIAHNETDALTASVASSLTGSRPFVIDYVTAVPTRVYTLHDGDVVTVTCCDLYRIEGIRFYYSYEETFPITITESDGSTEPTVTTTDLGCTPTSVYFVPKPDFIVFQGPDGSYDDSAYIPDNTCRSVAVAPATIGETKTIVAQLLGPTPAGGGSGGGGDTKPSFNPLGINTPQPAPAPVKSSPPDNQQPAPQVQGSPQPSHEGPVATNVAAPPEESGGQSGSGNNPSDSGSAEPSPSDENTPNAQGQAATPAVSQAVSPVGGSGGTPAPEGTTGSSGSGEPGSSEAPGNSAAPPPQASGASPSSNAVSPSPTVSFVSIGVERRVDLQVISALLLTGFVALVML